MSSEVETYEYGDVVTLVSGERIFCFEATEKFAFFAPFTDELGDESLKLDTLNTFIYSNNETIDNSSPIQSIEVFNDDLVPHTEFEEVKSASEGENSDE
jgi:hypothetical protein